MKIGWRAQPVRRGSGQAVAPYPRAGAASRSSYTTITLPRSAWKAIPPAIASVPAGEDEDGEQKEAVEDTIPQNLAEDQTDEPEAWVKPRNFVWAKVGLRKTDRIGEPEQPSRTNSDDSRPKSRRIHGITEIRCRGGAAGQNRRPKNKQSKPERLHKNAEHMPTADRFVKKDPVAGNARCFG